MQSHNAHLLLDGKFNFLFVFSLHRHCRAYNLCDTQLSCYHLMQVLHAIWFADMIQEWAFRGWRYLHALSHTAEDIELILFDFCCSSLALLRQLTLVNSQAESIDLHYANGYGAGQPNIHICYLQGVSWSKCIW